MSLQRVFGIVVDLCPEEDYSVHHQTLEDIHLCDVELSFFQDIWVEILAVDIRHSAALHFHYIIESQPVHAEVACGVVSEIVLHYLIIYIIYCVFACSPHIMYAPCFCMLYGLFLQSYDFFVFRANIRHSFFS